MKPKRLEIKSGCAVELALSVLGGLWKPLIVFNLSSGKRRFMELSRLIPNATQRMLALALRELEADGVVARHVFAEVPPRVEYELTPLGHTLEPVMLVLRDWGQRYRAEQQDLPPMDEVCSTGTLCGIAHLEESTVDMSPETVR